MANLEDIGKETYFEKHGYTWDPRIECYVNKEEWKIFSKDYIDDHSFEILLVNLKEEPSPGKWKFYFDTESPIDVHNLRKHYGVIAADIIK
jgi:hypothetical protein